MLNLTALQTAALTAVLAFAPAMSAAETALKPVKLITAGAQALPLERTFYGQVKARRTVDLAFQVGGQILQFPVIEGSKIAAGDMIAQLDLETFQLTRDQASLQKAQADRTLERLDRLRGTAASQVAVDDAETQAGLTGIALRNAEWALEQATLTAPFDGLIASRNTELFATVNAGQPVVRIHDMSELRIDVNVPEVLFQRAGRDPDFDIVAKFPAMDGTIPLQVREFDAETSAVGQTYRITFAMTPPEGLTILPGSSVTVRVRARAGESAILLPATAIVASPEGQTGVMIFDPDNGKHGAAQGQVRWQAVEIAPTQSGNVNVVAGLEPGQEVVRTGGAALSEGQAVRRFTGFTN